MGERSAHPIIIGLSRLVLRWPHISPNDSALLESWIGADFHFRLKCRSGRLRRHVDTVAILVEFPAVIDTAQSAFFIAREKKRRTAVRTIGLDETHMSFGIAEGDEVFAG